MAVFSSVRWAAIGAAVTIAVVGGGLLANGSSNPEKPLVPQGITPPYADDAPFHAITPVRALDTRRSTAISNATYRLVVEGTIATINSDGSTTNQSVVPTSATGVAINLTVTEGRKNGGYGFVTAFPCNATSDSVPNASSLNFENNIDIANALSVKTSFNGSVCFYVYGEADLIVDIAGYYDDERLEVLEGDYADNDDEYTLVFPIDRNYYNFTYSGTHGGNTSMQLSLQNGTGRVGFDVPGFIDDWSNDSLTARRLTSIRLCFPTGAFSSGGYISKVEIFASGSSTAIDTESLTNTALTAGQCELFPIIASGLVDDSDYYSYRVELTIADTAGSDGDVLIGNVVATFETYSFVPSL